MISVREASPGETDLTEPVSRVLAEAFIADPWASYLFPPDAEDRVQKIYSFFQPMVRAGLLFGKIFLTEPIVVGAVVAMAPGQWDLTKEQRTTVGLENLRESIGDGYFERMEKYTRRIEQFHRQDLPDKHWYLELAGVTESYRKSGVGSSLITQLLACADADGVSCYLETSETRNLRLYRRFGFDIVRHGVDPEGGLPYWTMIRKSRYSNEVHQTVEATPSIPLASQDAFAK